MISNVYRVNDNVGDMASSPRLYFDFPVAIERLQLEENCRPADLAIFGGGGQFHFPWLCKVVERVKGLRIAWGIGSNCHGSSVVEYPDWITEFSLMGVRDWNTGLPWVPCVSCMHPIFDQPHEITREVVAYENIHSEIGLPQLGVPHAFNRFGTMAEAVAFLGSAAIVVTNSYHGAYWGTLLGRKVIALPVSSKFHAFRHPPVLTDCRDWRAALPRAQVYETALRDCREANRSFATEAISLIRRNA